MSDTETIPQVWDDDRDATFFRIAAQIFSCEFCFGATVLLASYDADGMASDAIVVVEPVDESAEVAPAALRPQLRTAGDQFSA